MSSKQKKERIKIVLPKGWVVRPSTKFPDRVYYFNVNTGCSMWTPPTQSGKPNVNNIKQNDMVCKKEGVPEHTVTKKQPAETATAASEQSSCSSKQDDESGSNAFMKAIIKENYVYDRKRRYKDSETFDSEKCVGKKKPLELDFQCSVTPKQYIKFNNITNYESTIKESVTSVKNDQQSELLQAIVRTSSKTQPSRSDITQNLSENWFSSLPHSSKKEPIEALPSQCASALQKSDTTPGLPSRRLLRRDKPFDLRHVLEDKRRTSNLLEPLPSNSNANGCIKETAANCKRYSAGDADKGLAERRMQRLQETLIMQREANEKKAYEVQEKSLAHKRDASGTLCKNVTCENENLQKPVDERHSNGYSSATEAVLSPPLSKSSRVRQRRRSRQNKQTSCLDQYKDGGLEAFFTNDGSASDAEVPSKTKRARQSTPETSTSIPTWYPKSDCDPDSSDLDTSSSSGKNLGTKRLVKLRQALSNGTAQDIRDFHQNSEELSASVSPEENQHPETEAQNDKVQNESEAWESMDWEPLEDLSVSVQWVQDNNKSSTSNVLNKINEWYIVLDTNIFITNLKVVEELRDRNDKVLGYPVLIIPTVVLRELEGLKVRSPGDRGPKGAIRAAIKFINYNLRTLNPRLRAQGALNTVDVPELEIEIGDDKILQCCLFLLKQTERVILMTNDCNLRNRAKSFSIIACHPLDIQDAIQELYHCSSQPKLDALLSDGTSTMLQPSQPKTAAQIEAVKVDTITCKLKSALKDVLSEFLQAEMEAVFEDKWKSLIFIKPPWSVLQVLECLRKHWIACIAFVLPKYAIELIEKLYKFFNTKYESHGLGHTLAEVKEILKIGLQLCSLLPTSKPYDDTTFDSIRIIREMLEEVKEDTSPSIAAAPEASCNSNDVNNVTEKEESNSSSMSDVQGVEAVHQALERIYQYTLSFCGTMFDVLEHPHDIPYTRPERLPSLASVRETFPGVYTKLHTLLEALRGVLHTSPAVLTVDHSRVQELYLSFAKYFGEDIHSALAIKDVLEFCAANQREMLEGALSKLVQCEDMLNVGMDIIVELVVL